MVAYVNMDLDIIRKIKLTQLKATFGNLRLWHKISLIIILVSLVNMLLPHQTWAQTSPNLQSQNDLGPVLVFDAGNTDWQDYVDQLNLDLTDQYYQEQSRLQAIKQQKLAAKVKAYLAEQGSPLAEYTTTLVSLRNWKKIVALANAESSLCKRYQKTSANCWGVGGANLWDLGSTLGEGVVAMNYFLNNYPKRSSVKYAQMSFERMNGLYKQPPADHWLNNNQVVYEDLLAIEASIE